MATTPPAPDDTAELDQPEDDEYGTAPKTFTQWTRQALDALHELVRQHTAEMIGRGQPVHADIERYRTVSTVETLLRMMNGNPLHWSWDRLRNTDFTHFRRMIIALGAIEPPGSNLVPERLLRLAEIERAPEGITP